MWTSRFLWKVSFIFQGFALKFIRIKILYQGERENEKEKNIFLCRTPNDWQGFEVVST